MAGRGPAPKVNAIRRNVQNQAGFEQIVAEPSPQPKLPQVWRTVTEYDHKTDEWVEKRRRMAWTKQTQDWWKMWGQSPLMQDATANDWSELLDTALLHNAYWGGSTAVAAELRLRVAKFGATPEDRLRLKKQFAPPDPKGDDTGPKKSGARARRGALHAV